ncbi:MAG: GMC family oxidoreductase [Wenzhouxiangellaceae bacterium]
MIRNGTDIATGTELSAQVCVIGSGPAGITAAWELQKAGKKVILIEGGRNFANDFRASWPDKVLMYNGQAEGLFATNEPNFLILPFQGHTTPAWERERVYGGTSTHWGGQSRPLNPITFKARPGYAGWPIDRTDLDPFYAKAAALCKLHGDDFSAEYWAKELQAEVTDLSGFETDMYQFIGGQFLNFATRDFNGGTIGDSDAEVIVNANLLEIEHQQGSVSKLHVASMSDGSCPQPQTRFTIKADAYVLACGAVANARQLLLSNVGNEYDLVGRYFMCHPLSQNGVIRITSPYLNYDQSRLMNGQTPTGQWRDANGVTVTGRFVATPDEVTRLGIGQCWFWAGGGQYYFEMAENPDSRVTLADTKDPVFGQPQTRIDWQLSPRDQQTYEQNTALFKKAVNQLGGDVSYPDWETVKSQLVVNGHHIGTTRMASEAKNGVVDANLKVHSQDNLYVAGSSVFPCTGIANPTFTIITLSIRLAEHLDQTLGCGSN